MTESFQPKYKLMKIQKDDKRPNISKSDNKLKSSFKVKMNNFSRRVTSSTVLKYLNRKEYNNLKDKYRK